MTQEISGGILYVYTECPKSYRKSVLPLLKYTANTLEDTVYICGNLWDTQYINMLYIYICYILYIVPGPVQHSYWLQVGLERRQDN